MTSPQRSAEKNERGGEREVYRCSIGGRGESGEERKKKCAPRLGSRDERAREDDARSCDEREVNRKTDERTNERGREMEREENEQVRRRGMNSL